MNTATPENVKARTDATAQAPMPEPTDADASTLPEALLEALAIVRETVTLAVLEVWLAVRSVPVILMLALTAAVLALLSWLALSVALAWWVADLWQAVLPGLLAALGLQVMALLVSVVAFRFYVRRLKLPETRRCLRQMMGGLHASE